MMVIYLFLQERPCLKYVNHIMKFLELEEPEDDQFKSVLHFSRLVGLCVIAYKTINHGM